MKKRSLSLLLSLVMLAVLMLGSCVSVLASGGTVTYKDGIGADGKVCLGETIELTATENVNWWFSYNGETGYETDQVNTNTFRYTVPGDAEIGDTFTVGAATIEPRDHYCDDITFTVYEKPYIAFKNDDNCASLGDTKDEGPDADLYMYGEKVKEVDSNVRWELVGNYAAGTAIGSYSGKLKVDENETEDTITIQATCGGRTATADVHVYVKHDINVYGGTANPETAAKDTQVALRPDFKKHATFKRWIAKTDGIDIHFNKFDMIDEEVDILAYWQFDLKEGADQEFTHGSKKVLSFTSYGEIRDFKGVELNGHWLKGKYYDVKPGSTEVTLDNELLNNLDAGTYTLTFIFRNGYTDVDFEVKALAPEEHAPTGWQGWRDEEPTAPATVTTITEVTAAPATTTGAPLISPKTADSAPVALFAALALVSAAAFVSMKKRG